MPVVSSPDPPAVLNPAQREAVEHTEGPLLVLAGAGTGKTRVLTARIAHILARGFAFPHQILAVTFTNKAAAEMRSRVAALSGGEAASLWLGTFHSTCLRILRRHAAALGLPVDFTVIDQDDQLRLIRNLMQENHIDEKRAPPKMVAALIQRWKDRALAPENTGRGEDDTARRVYGWYRDRLRTIGAADFGDLILHCITLFRDHPEILAEYHRQFRYILVDEYQDTNVAQYLWLRLLAQGSNNLCCVGDDDQSIYGWRGAEVENILRFEKDFPGAKVVRLERNYRSTPDILAAASALIAHNKGRLGKTLYTEGESRRKVDVVSLWDERAEAEYIAQEIDALQKTERMKLSGIAILVRAGFQTRAFEECFMARRLPYKVLGGLRFYERLEIRDAIAYLRVLAQPANDLALLRIINLPKRGVGDATVEAIRVRAVREGVPVAAAIPPMLADGSLKGKAGNALNALLALFARWRAMLETQTHVEVAKAVLHESGYLDMWKNEKTPEAEGRVENLKELLTALEEFESLAQFLEHISLVMDGDDALDRDMVSIITMHGAKGLEFDAVFLAGWEEGLFPSQKAIDEKGQAALEEERRLAYVGVTRARKKLTVSFASGRRIYGQWVTSIPSRFIDELPPEHTRVINAHGPGYRGAASQHGGRSGAWPSGAGLREKSVPAWRRPEVISDSAPPSSNAALWHPGERVFHQKFGYGKIVKAEGDHLTVAFDHTDNKTLLADYVKKG